jgi:hypothetical protein
MFVGCREGQIFHQVRNGKIGLKVGKCGEKWEWIRIQ